MIRDYGARQRAVYSGTLPVFDDRDSDSCHARIPGRCQATVTETIDVPVDDISFASLTASGCFSLGGLAPSSFSKLLHAIPMPAMLVDPSLCIVFANEACAKLGAPPESMAGMSLFSRLAVDRELLKVRQAALGVLTQKKPQVREAILKAGGAKIWGRLHFRSIRMGEEKLILILVEDLTAEKRQIILTKREEVRLRQSRDDLEQRVAARTTELTAINEQLQKEIAERVRAQDELRKAHDELEKRVEQRTQLLVETNKSLTREIFARRRVEIALRESEEKYRAMVENIEEGYYEVDAEGRLIFLNDAGCRILGSSKDDLLGKLCSEIIGETEAFKLRQVFDKVRSTGKSVKTCHWQLTTNDGATKDIEMSVALVSDRSGQPAGFRGACRDMTDVKRVNEELRRLEKLESLGVLAGGIAHDFNNILTAIQGNMGLARMLVEDRPKAARLLEEAEKAAVRSQALTRQLLTFSRGGTPIKNTVFLGESLTACCEFALTGSNVSCEFAFNEDLWPVEADEGQLTQVFSNLSINAKQAMPKGGLLRIQGENLEMEDKNGLPLAPGRYVRISFIDEGVGIPPEQLSRIFDPYYTTKQNGNGLGLAISYSIVKNHGGLITVESKAPAGSTFHVYMPASRDREFQARDSEAGPIPGQGKILLMDDQEAIRDLGKEMLSMLGYEVELAKDGAEAVQSFQSAKNMDAPFDVVIMDLTVPGGMGGYEAIKELRAIEPGVKAIVSSGYSDDPIMGEYLDHGFSGIIPKPYTIEKLSHELNRLMLA